MTGAMYAAISGLKTHMSKLNIIGNNVANVNTYGYKSGRATFQEALYTTSQSGSNGTSYVGGRNPSQIGYGVELRSVDLKMTNGQYAPTGYPSDCTIDGEGFFLVGDKEVLIEANNPESLKSLNLSRVGDLDFKADGYLTDARGNIVYGFLAVPDGTNTDKDGNVIMKPTNELVPIRLPFKDSGGYTAYPKLENNVLTEPKKGDAGKTVGTDTYEVTDTRISVSGISIDGATGKITCKNKDSKETVVVGYIALGVPSNPAGVSHISGPYYQCGEGAGDLTIVSMGGAVEGYVGNNTTETADSPAKMKIGKGGTTKLVTGGLELGNADLATEITEMITTQRGYQANTRIITVTDSMLEELVNMKR